MITADFTKIIAPLKQGTHGSNGAIKFSNTGIGRLDLNLNHHGLLSVP